MAHRQNTIKDFWLKVNKTDGCWNWSACRDKQGYGEFRFKMKKYKAHRFSWKVSFGDIPKGILVCHKCDNPSCVNPQHLFLGTQLDNIRDMVAKGRGFNRSGENNGMHKLSLVQVREIKKLYKSGKYLQKELSDIFKVGQDHLSRIINNKRRQFSL